jgi:hypothetical protein
MIRRSIDDLSRPLETHRPEAAEETVPLFVEQLDRWRKQLEVSMQRNPAASLIAAVGVGLLLGWLIKRS